MKKWKTVRGRKSENKMKTNLYSLNHHRIYCNEYSEFSVFKPTLDLFIPHTYTSDFHPGLNSLRFPAKIMMVCRLGYNKSLF